MFSPSEWHLPNVLLLVIKHEVYFCYFRAQEIMREAMKTPTVTVEIEREKVPPLVLPDSPRSPDGQVGRTPPTPPPKTSALPVVPARSPTTALSTNGPTSPVPEKTNLIAPTNTRRIGRKLYIQLMKG